MSATPERSKSPLADAVTDDSDQLRSLVSAMLDGTYKEDFYLWDVASLCRAKPEFGRRLLALIDRYYRLGQMPATQHRKIKEKIEQSLASGATAGATPGRRDRDAPTASTNARASTVTTELPLQPSSDTPPLQPPGPTVTAPLPISSSAPVNTSAPVTSSTPVTSSAPASTSAPVSSSRPVDPAPPDTAHSAPRSPVRPPLASASAAVSRDKLIELLNGLEDPPDAVAPPPIPPAPLSKPIAASAPRPFEQPEQVGGPGLIEPPEPPAPLIRPGAILRNRYELQGLLGYGGMASVYKALDRYRASLGLQDCCVALKLVLARTAHAAQVAALGREFHNAQQLSHPNIINVYEIDHEGDASFYTMELLEGEQLNQLLERIGGALPPRYAFAIIRDIGAAIAHAHSRGAVHADLKPQNICITYGGQVRVLDFGGLSHSPAGSSSREPWIEELTPHTRQGVYRTATPAYASCEQLEGQRVDPRDDVYGLACIAYELLTGRHPFEGKSSTEARAQHLSARRPALLSASSWRALRRGLAWQRERRPQQLWPWLEQLGLAAAAERLPPSYQLRASKPPRLWLSRLAAVAALLLALVAVAWALRQSGSSDWRQPLATAERTLQNAGQQLNEGLQALTAPPSPSTATPAASTRPSIEPDGPTASDFAATDSAAASGPRAAAGSASAGRLRAASHGAAGSRRSASSRLVAGLQQESPTDSPTHTARAEASLAAYGATTDSSGGGAADTVADDAQGVTFASPSYAVADGAPAARVVVRRTGDSHGDVRFVWWTQEDTAKADVDYAPLGRRVEHIPRGAKTVTIFVPIISNPLRHQSEMFYVALGSPGGADPDAPIARATVTIERGG